MDLSPYYTKQIDCIHCKKKFNTTKIRMKMLKIASTDADFRPVYENDVHGYFYNAYVCEHCGFAFTDDFSTYFMPGTSEVLQQQISNKWVHHDFSGERSPQQALQAYQLALVSGQIKKENISHSQDLPFAVHGFIAHSNSMMRSYALSALRAINT